MPGPSKEQLPTRTPEYLEAIEQLYEVASTTMQNNPDFVDIELHKVYFKGKLRLKSEAGEIITLTKTQRWPIPESPDWLTGAPRIEKWLTASDGREYLHDYTSNNGLIFDDIESWPIGAKRVYYDDSQRAALAIEDVRELTSELYIWALEDPELYRKPRYRRLGKHVLYSSLNTV